MNEKQDFVSKIFPDFFRKIFYYGLCFSWPSRQVLFFLGTCARMFDCVRARALECVRARALAAAPPASSFMSMPSDGKHDVHPMRSTLLIPGFQTPSLIAIAPGQRSSAHTFRRQFWWPSLPVDAPQPRPSHANFDGHCFRSTLLGPGLQTPTLMAIAPGWRSPILMDIAFGQRLKLIFFFYPLSCSSWVFEVKIFSFVHSCSSWVFKVKYFSFVHFFVLAGCLNKNASKSSGIGRQALTRWKCLARRLGWKVSEIFFLS